jgi:hypothetical protein
MKRMLGLLILLFPMIAHAGALQQCKEKKDYGPVCTQARVQAVDADANGIMEAAEIRAYVIEGDFSYAQSISVIKTAIGAAGIQEDAALVARLNNGVLDETLLMIGPGSCAPDTGLPCASQWRTSEFVQHAQERNVAWRSTAKLELPIKVSRKASDPLDPRGGADLKPRPLVVSYREDDVKGEKGMQLMGTISGPPVCSQDARPMPGAMIVQCGPVLGLDVDSFSSSKGKNSSDVSFGFNVELLKTPAEETGATHRISLTPSYLTDADFGRDVVLATVTYAMATPRFGGPGYYHCLNGCGPNSWELVWLPSLSLQAGDVRDASGNAVLEKQHQAGSYVRVVPMLGLRLYGWDRRGAFGLDLAHVRDINSGQSKSYGEISYTYDIASNVAVTAIFRKGYKVQTLDNIDSILFGLGFTF